MKTKKKILVATMAIGAFALMAFTMMPNTPDGDNPQKQMAVTASADDNEPLGQTWITTENYGGCTYYVLKATNTSGECFYLSGNIRIISTGEVVPVGKNIPASANRKDRAVRVYTLTQQFEKIEDSFVADDCIW